MTPTPGPEAEAIAHFQAGRIAEAETAFHAILEKNPRHANALHALGVIAMQSPERIDEAIAMLQRANKAEPGAFAILYNLGSALRRGGRHAEALHAFRRAISLNVRSAEAHLGLATTLREMGDRTRARESLAVALRLDANLVAARYSVALIEIDERRDAAAEVALRQVVELQPGHAEAWNHLGLIAHRGGQLDVAMGLYARALEAQPGLAAALVNWGNAWKDLGDLRNAAERYRAALEADPNATAALVNAASVAMEVGDFVEARRLATRALEIRPLLSDAQYALGLVQLREHDFERGWEGFERRFETSPPIASIHSPRRPILPIGDLARTRRLAIRMEQGLGDQILYSTLLPELADSGIATVVELDPRLRAAYQRSLPSFEYPAPAEASAALAQCDHELPVGSLPVLFRRSLDAFERQPKALLSADPERVAEMQRLLGDGISIAIAWRSFQGAGRRHIGDRKSIPLQHFAQLAKSGARLVDLQYGDVAAERKAFDEGHPGLRFDIPNLDRRDDIEGVLAAIAACDLVITASNVTAHLAGALGKRTWLVYLRANPPFHYWAAGSGGRSLWYPSVEILSDPAWARWDDAFRSVSSRLQKHE